MMPMTAAAGSRQSNAGDLGTGCGGASSPPASAPDPNAPNAPVLIVEGHPR